MRRVSLSLLHHQSRRRRFAFHRDRRCTTHFSSPLENETTLGCKAADRAVIAGPKTDLPNKRLMENSHFAKSPRPSERAQSSAWAICLGISRATAIQPDNRYLAMEEPKFKNLPQTSRGNNPGACGTGARVLASSHGGYAGSPSDGLSR